MPQILHRRIEKLIVPEPEILMLRPSVLLAQRIVPHAVPTALTIISLILRAQTGNNRLQQDSPLLALSIIILGEIIERNLAGDSAERLLSQVDKALLRRQMSAPRDIYRDTEGTEAGAFPCNITAVFYHTYSSCSVHPYTPGSHTLLSTLLIQCFPL